MSVSLTICFRNGSNSCRFSGIRSSYSVKYSGNVEAAKVIGKKIAEQALAKDIKQVVFDRNGFLYHGRVKALSAAAREHGLVF